MSGSSKPKVIFLDRDGVLNKEKGGYICKPEDFELNDGVIESLKTLKSKGFLLIVITNQGGISKGLYSHQILSEIHKKLTDELELNGIKIDAIYYCPHHPLTSNCFCRKPESLLLEKALARFGIAKPDAVFIGDAERDEQAAVKAGIRAIRIESNESLLQIAQSL